MEYNGFIFLVHQASFKEQPVIAASQQESTESVLASMGTKFTCLLGTSQGDPPCPQVVDLELSLPSVSGLPGRLL